MKRHIDPLGNSETVNVFDATPVMDFANPSMSTSIEQQSNNQLSGNDTLTSQNPNIHSTEIMKTSRSF